MDGEHPTGLPLLIGACKHERRSNGLGGAGMNSHLLLRLHILKNYVNYNIKVRLSCNTWEQGYWQR
jgi:hypothetical protein